MRPGAAVAMAAGANLEVEGAVDAVLLSAVDARKVGSSARSTTQLTIPPVPPLPTAAGRWACSIEIVEAR